METVADVFEKFVADGNEIIGPIPTIKGKFDLSWVGSNSILEFGEEVLMTSTKIRCYKGGGRIKLEDKTEMQGFLSISKGSTLQIGSGTRVNRPSMIRAQEGANLEIGTGCLLSNVKILTSDLHSIVDLRTGKRTNAARGIVIENDVWLAEDVKVAKGSRIGTGAVIAAGSFVRGLIPPFCLAAGRPAIVVKTGVSWDRRALPVEFHTAPKFTGGDIPLDKEILRQLVSVKRYSLVLSVIEASIEEFDTVFDMPVFARWYLVFCRHKLKKSAPEDQMLLSGVINEAPDHKAAARLQRELLST